MSTSLISSIFLVGSTVLRQKVASGKFGAFAFFNQTRPLAVRSAMLRLRSVAVMSAGATLLGFMYGLIPESRFFN